MNAGSLDFIGDIHGYADKLQELLEKMGYAQTGGGYTHPNRKVVFLGDYIDRGPQIRKVLELVRNMVESGNAIALMGNHEYNALCFHCQESEGGHLRKHLIKNIVQHYETLRQFQNRQEEYESYLDWFMSLPLFWENDACRAVHACWNNEAIGYLQLHLKQNTLTDDILKRSVRIGTPLYRFLNRTLKGREVLLPDGLSFKDKDGTVRNRIRIKWWEDPTRTTCKDLSIEPIKCLPDRLLDLSILHTNAYYSETEKPVFFGHYWLKGNPFLYKKNVCCLDYSIAQNGHLAAYRFDGEQVLDPDKIVMI